MPRQSKAEREKLARIRRNFKVAVEADRTNRREAMADVKFINEPGAQWDDYVRRERGDRPCYEFNKLRVTVKRVVNDIRMNRPQGKVRAVEDSDRKVAQIFEGQIRNIWNTSDADTAIDQAAEYSVGAGMGAWRIVTKYASDDVFDQDIVIEPIRNPFCLYADPSAEDPMKRDAKWWFLTTRISNEAFEAKYGKKAEKSDWEGSEEFDDDGDWGDEETVRLVEYWYREPVIRTLLLLEDGRTVDAEEAGPDAPNVLRSREVQSYKIRNCIASGSAILEEGEWAGSQFPFVVVYGESMMVDGKHVWFGLTRFAKDAQRAYNASRTYAVEAIALSPQAKFWATPKMAEGHIEKWSEAHKKNFPFMLFNPDGQMGGPPVPMPGANVPPAIINEIGISSEDIKGVTGIFDASLGARSNETSGTAIRARQVQGEMAVFNYSDNIGKGVRRTWELLVDLIPKIYDTERAIRILGPDGAEDYIRVNAVDPVTGGRMNDLTVGKYDVTVTLGPSFATQRQEGAEIYMGLVNSYPQLMQIAGDLVFKSLDVPLSDEIAERIKLILPPAVQKMIATGKSVPPEAQAAMVQASQAMDMVQQIGQQLQQQQQAMEGEKAVIEADKSEVRAQIVRLQAEKKVLDAHYREVMAKIEVAQLRAGKQIDEKATAEDRSQIESERIELDAQLQAALAEIHRQAGEFMAQAAALMAEIHAKTENKPRAVRVKRDEAGKMIGGVVTYDDGEREISVS